jgi:hypothetical protein
MSTDREMIQALQEAKLDTRKVPEPLRSETVARLNADPDWLERALAASYRRYTDAELAALLDVDPMWITHVRGQHYR